MTTDGTSALGDNSRGTGILKAELACGTSSVFRNWHQWDLELMAPGEGLEVIEEDTL